MVTDADTDLAAGVEAALRRRLHTTIEQLGVEQARGMAATSADRACVDTAHQVMTDEDPQAGFIHAGFALTALPHRRVEEPEWIREAAGLTLRVESGKDEHGAVV